MVASNLEMEEVLRRVASWPATKRFSLARRLLETLEQTSDERETVGYPSKDVLEMLATGRPAPDDAECRRILEDELARKYIQ